MAAQRPPRRSLKADFTLGGMAAENDHLLVKAYFDNGQYNTIASQDDRRCFVIGRTGSGKSAAFQHLHATHRNRVITVLPENLSLSYLANSNAIQRLLALDVQVEPFVKALWKHVLIVEVLRHRYQISTRDGAAAFLSQFRARFARDPAKARAMEYLEAFGDTFFTTTDERVKQIVDKFEERVSAAGSVALKPGIVELGINGDSAHAHSREVHTELSALYQRVVNDTQLPRLNQLIRIVNEDILREREDFTYLLIDDLDTAWIDSRVSRMVIKCLFEAVIDLLSIRNLKILVALRTNIFQQLEYDPSKGRSQQEKFQGLSIDICWTKRDLAALLEKRVAVASKHYIVVPALDLDELLPGPHRKYGHAVEYMLDQTLLRPRDAIVYLNSCVRLATGRRTVEWDDIFKAQTHYSRDRLRALCDEWKDPYTDIDTVLLAFKGKCPVMTRAELDAVVDDIALLVVEDGDTFGGQQWLSTVMDEYWAESGPARDWHDRYGKIARLLYDIGFIGCAEDELSPAVYSFDDPDGFDDISESDAVVFSIHPAFRRALRMQRVNGAAGDDEDERSG
jgi:hypothetical protein